MLKQILTAFCFLGLSIASCLYAAPVMGRGGSIASNAVNPTWAVGPDGIAHFANIDPQTLLGGIPASSIALSSMNAVQLTQVGTPGGVASLDGNGRVTAPVASSNISSGPSVRGVTVPIVQLYTPNGSAISGGYETMHIGGVRLSLAHSPYGIFAAQAGSLTITSGLNGPYNAGCGLCLFNEPQAGKLGAVSGEDYRTGFVATHDGVMLEEGIANAQARLILPVATYTATSVQLTTPLSANEMSQIKPGMYIVTNSVPPNAPQTPLGDPSLNGLLPSFQNYSGLVKDVSTDGKTIDVYGWGQEMTKGTALPSTTSLDTVWDPKQSGAVVYVGAANKAFAENDFSNYDGSVAGGTGAASSLIHRMEHLEIDENVSNETRQYAVQYHGITIGSNASRPDLLTKDSYEISLNGGQSQFLTMSPQWWTIPINSDPLYIGQLQGPALKTGAQAVLASFGQSTNTGNASFQSFHYIRPMIYNTRTASDGSGTDYQNIETDIGVGIDGARGTVNALQEHIALNPANYHNGISLCGYATCALSIDGNGVGWMPHDFHITNGSALWIGGSYVYTTTDPTSGAIVTHAVVPNNASGAGVLYVDGAFGAGGAATLASLKVVGATHDGEKTLAALPYSGNRDGDHYWCIDCKLNGIVGAEVYWHASVEKWTDSQNNGLFN
ncbi:hypothetical protein [Neokomagataea thailandica]|nr:MULTISPECIES: hypothetical protein [Neokomagataea]